MKTKGTLTADQSRFLGGVLNTPLLAESPKRDLLLQLYLNSESEDLIPSEFDEVNKKFIDYAIATSKQAQKMDLDATPEEIINATPSPFEAEEIE